MLIPSVLTYTNSLLSPPAPEQLRARPSFVLTSSGPPVILVNDHPSEGSLGTCSPLAGERVSFPWRLAPTTRTIAHPVSPRLGRCSFGRTLIHLLTSSVSSVNMKVDHAREGSLATRPTLAVGRVFFAVDSHQLVTGRGINLRFQTTVLISAVSCNHGVAKPAGDYVH